MNKQKLLKKFDDLISDNETKRNDVKYWDIWDVTLGIKLGLQIARSVIENDMS